MKFKKESAFTLIELLVVIAIIAILAAILFPVFGRARENARRSSCQSNLKQAALGVLQYSQDYDERFPSGVTNNVPGSLGWATSIQPYVKSTQLFQCPSEPNGPSTTPTPPDTTSSYTDYYYNAMLSFNGDYANPDFSTGISLSAAINPTLTVMLGDGRGDGSTASYRSNGCGTAGNQTLSNPNFANCGSVASTPPGAFASVGGLGGINSRAWQRHLEGTNLAFADGHVKWYRGQNTAGASPTVIGSTQIYNPRAGFNRSGQSPTFNATNENDS